MFKLTITVDTYDDDFLLIRNGVPLREGHSYAYFGATVAACYEEFAKTTWVGHNHALDRDAPLGSGYGHVHYYRDFFGKDFKNLLVSEKVSGGFEHLVCAPYFTSDECTGTYSLREYLNSGYFDIFHGGNREFYIQIEKITQEIATFDAFSAEISTVLAKREAYIRDYDTTVVRPLLQALHDSTYGKLTPNDMRKASSRLSDAKRMLL